MKRVLLLMAALVIIPACQKNEQAEIKRPEPYHAQPSFPSEPNPDWYVNRKREDTEV